MKNLENIEIQANRIAAKWNVSLTFDYGVQNQIIITLAKEPIIALTQIVLNDSNEIDVIFVERQMEEVYDEYEEPTGEYETCKSETLYEGPSLMVALNKMRVAS